MSGSSKQIYIPTIDVKGYYVEEIGGSSDRIVYPGGSFEISLAIDDFENPEEYHTAWIAITRAVKAKLSKHATGNSS